MNPRQMLRMQRRHKISLVFDREDRVWIAAGPDQVEPDTARNLWTVEMTRHVGETPESAIEDYCGAHNIEWDRED